MLPPVLADKRWQQFLLLAGTGILQSLCLIMLIDRARTVAVEGTSALLSYQWLLMAGAISVLALGRYIERYYAELLAQKYIFNLRQSVFEKSQMLPVRDLDIPGKGGTLLRLTGDMSAIRNWIVQGVAPLTVLGLWCLVSLAGLYMLSPFLVLVMLVPVALAIVGNYLLGRQLYSASERLRKRRGQLIRNVTEKLRHLHLIRTFNQHGKESRRFSRQSSRLMESQLHRARFSALMRGMNEAVLLLSLLMLIGFSLQLKSEGVISGEMVAVLVTGALYQLGQLRRLARLYEFWTLNKVAVKKLDGFLQRPSVEEGLRRRNRKPFSLELKRVRCRNRLAPQSFKLEQHSRVQLVGAPGSGKSTLMAAIAGLVKPDGGRILLSGSNVKRFREQVISQQICLVSSSLPLLRGTLEKNLFYGARKQNQDYTKTVLAICELSKTADLPAGLDSLIDEDGTNLSAGLKYRIMLARALLRKPELLLIDEDVAHQSEHIQRVLSRISAFFDGAIVICSEHPSLASLCQQQWVIESKANNNNVVSIEYYANQK